MVNLRPIFPLSSPVIFLLPICCLLFLVFTKKNFSVILFFLLLLYTRLDVSYHSLFYFFTPFVHYGAFLCRCKFVLCNEVCAEKTPFSRGLKNKQKIFSVRSIPVVFAMHPRIFANMIIMVSTNNRYAPYHSRM